MKKLRETPDPSFVNFIGRCLEWDPRKRLTPEEGLCHEWIVKGLPPNIVLHNPLNNPYQKKTAEAVDQPSIASNRESSTNRSNAALDSRQSQRKSASNKQQ